MARKKKVKETKATVTQPVISYIGEVKVQITDGKKVISSRKIKNSGKLPLFIFLARCLAGRYDGVDVLRPRFIQLFNITDIEHPFADITEWTKCSSPIGLSTTPSIDSQPASAQNIENASCTIKFVIPFSMITFDENKPINLLALKSADNATEESLNDVCAYIILNEGESLIPTTLQHSDKYNIIIDWTLRIED